MKEPYQFVNYLQTRPVVPDWGWTIAKCISVSSVLGLIYLMIIQPQLALTLVWKMIVPLLPLIFFLLPGLWRNVCPFAAMNQIPRRMGFSMDKNLPPLLKEYGFVIGITALFTLVTLRKVWFNTDSEAAAILIGASMLFAFFGGVVFKGKSGWCGSFCPMLPVQRLYGQTPAVTVRNGHCLSCVGCTKNCYDFNPNAAFLADQYDPNEDYRNFRKFFAACFPGFVLAFYAVPEVPEVGIPQLFTSTFLIMLTSAGLFGLFDSYFKVSSFKLTVLFAIAALNIYYWYNIPSFINNNFSLGPAIAGQLAWGLHALLLLISVVWIRRTYFRETSYLIAMGKSSSTQVNKAGLNILKSSAKKRGVEITFTADGKTYAAEIGGTLLEVAEANGQKIESGCRMGSCGADPICIKEGMEYLAEIGEDERSTLERLGHGNNTRMACCSRIEKEGGITVSMEFEAGEGDAAICAPTFDIDPQVKQIVIIGNGVAGITAADHIRRFSKDCTLSIIGKEPHNFYNRMGIARLIHGRSAMRGLYLIDEDWYDKHGIQSFLNTQVKQIDFDNQLVKLGIGDPLPYDKLILASGSEALKPAVDGIGLKGVYVLRTAEDALSIRAFAQDNACQKAVVAGGGLLGLEAAYALKELGLQVTVLERGEWLMRRQLDRRAGEFLRILLGKIGLDVMTHAEVDSIHGENRMREVQLKDGCRLKTGLLLFAAGIKPNCELAGAGGLKTNRGIIVNSELQTSNPNVYAIGDAAEHEGMTYGLWTTAVEQAKIVAANVLGDHRYYKGSTPSTMLKVVGIDVYSVGQFDAKGPSQKDLFVEDVKQRRYCKIVIGADKIIGAIMIGKVAEAELIKKAIAHQTDISSIKQQLMELKFSGLSTLYDQGR